jgi:hypothetical protein
MEPAPATTVIAPAPATTAMKAATTAAVGAAASATTVTAVLSERWVRSESKSRESDKSDKGSCKTKSTHNLSFPSTVAAYFDRENHGAARRGSGQILPPAHKNRAGAEPATIKDAHRLPIGGRSPRFY